MDFMFSGALKLYAKCHVCVPPQNSKCAALKENMKTLTSCPRLKIPLNRLLAKVGDEEPF